jgi:lysyl-tRNA synthetase class 2
MPLHSHTTHSAPLWKRRFELERWIREYFWGLNYLEIKTPLLVQSPGMEPHLRPVQILHPSPVFLPTSPEFGMKKILAQGEPRIFQICSSFRDEPLSPEHRPEFTMLEFYEAQISLDDFQGRVEGLLISLSMRAHGKSQSQFRGHTIDWSPPWPRLRVVDLFQEHVGIDLRTHTTPESLAKVVKKFGLTGDAHETWDDLYFRLWLNLIEPKLPAHRPIFVTHYPVSQSSLCNRVKDEKGFEWANRFEVYAGGCELGNAFDELRDPVKQRQNFEHDQLVRREAYGKTWPESPIDEDLLRAISQMQPTCGIAMGVDRLAMVILGATQIGELIAVEPYWK